MVASLAIAATRKADAVGECFGCAGPAVHEVAGGFFDGCRVCTGCADLYAPAETRGGR